MAREGGALYEQEYKQLGIRVLYVNLLPPYSLMTTSKKVETLEDVAGLKIRANGPAMDKTARALGGVGVRVTSPELFDALSRGTVDGALWPIGSTIESGLQKLLKYTVVPSKLGGGTTFFAISESAWQKLDDETRNVMLEAGRKAQMHLCKYLDDLEVEVRNKLVADGNLMISTLSAEEAARWDDALVEVAEGWAKEMEGTGRPGTELLKAAREAPSQF
jgi:TRAP-type C4-dicarboxylate transport system substrate-binding protein